jgi:glycine/serine hydroxymethyltransferase
VLDDLDDTAVQARVKAQVLALCRRFPVYGD